MRRVLSMILALCLIIGLLPAVAVIDANAAVITRTMDIMGGSDGTDGKRLTATSDGATVTYTKNQENTLTDAETGEPLLDEEGNPLTEWVQVVTEVTDEATDPWNAKFYYDAEAKRFTLILKGAKVTKSCAYAFGVNDRNVTTQRDEFTVIVTEDSYFANCRALSSVVSGSYRWEGLYIYNENDATLYVDNSAAKGVAAIHVMCPVIIDANITAKTHTYSAIFTQTTTADETITINGGKLDITVAPSGTTKYGIESSDAVKLNGGELKIYTQSSKSISAKTTLDIAEDLCYTVQDFEGNALTADALTTVGTQIVFTSYEAHTAGAWTESKTVCTVCGAEMICDEHAYTETVIKAPTCTEEGQATKTCSICGASEPVVLKKLPHSYVAVDGEVVDGAFERTNTCSVCGDSYTESVTVMTSTVTLWGTAVTVDTDATTVDIPEALYWVNGAEGGVPVAATAADDWNYRFAIVENIPTVTLRNANYAYAASFLYSEAVFDGKLKLNYEGDNYVNIPYKASSSYYFVYFKSLTNDWAKGHLYIVGAEDATLNVEGGSKDKPLIATANKVSATISGGTFKVERTNAGGSSPVIQFSYGKTVIENCNLTAINNVAVSYQQPIIVAGAEDHSGVTINNSTVYVEGNAYGGLCVGVWRANNTGVVSAAPLVINGDSDVKIISKKQTADNSDFHGAAIGARSVTVNGGSLEAQGAKYAVHITAADAPNLTSYKDGYKMYTAADGEVVTEYAKTTYLKIVPCDHATTETTLVGTNYVTACTHCGTEVGSVPCEHPTTKVVIDGTDFVTVCAVCGGEVKREAATPLDTAYSLVINNVTYKLTAYDIPVYTINAPKSGYFNVTETKEVVNEETGETTTETVTTLTAMDYAGQSTTDANEDNYNAKLIWHTGDAAPTLYLRDFVVDEYNDEHANWRKNYKGTVQTYAGIFTDTTAPLKIVVDGACVMQTYGGIHYRNELTIEGADDDATLTMYNSRVGILPTKLGSGYSATPANEISGYKMTLDVNLNITLTNWANAEYGHVIRTVGADMVINGGNIVTNYTGIQRSARGLAVLNSGNLIVNDGYIYSASYNSSNTTEAAIQVAGNIYVNGGTVEVASASQSGMKATNIYVSGGEVIANVYYGGMVVTDATGVIEITGGTIESTSVAGGYSAFMYSGTGADGKAAQFTKLPTGTLPTGYIAEITAGETKETAMVLTEEQIPLYGYDSKYMKIAIVKDCEHADVTVIAGKDATCTETGLTEGRVCNDCQRILVAQEEIPMVEHELVEAPAKEPTCIETGLTAGVKCANCDYFSVEQEVIDTVDCQYTFVEEKLPTCTEDGYYEYEWCPVCGEYSIPMEVNPALGHTEDEVAGYAATCTKAGLTDGVFCLVCEEWVTEQVEIPATGHMDTTETVTTVDATCTVAGSKTTTVTCACGEVVNETVEEIPATGHTEEIIPGKEATETEPGLTEGKKCSGCGEILVAQEEIPATGTGECTEHVYTDDNDAVCNNCGYIRQMVDQFDFVNYRVVFSNSDSTRKNIRAAVYNVGDNVLADPSDESALQKIDATAVTHWGTKNVNRILITEAGNYVVLLKYNVGTSTVKVPLLVSVSADPKLIIDPNNNKITLLNTDETHVNYRVEMYYLGDETVEDITDAAALKEQVGEPEVIWGKKYISRITLIEEGNYVLHLCYNIGTSARITVAQQFSVLSIPDFKIDANNMFVAVDENPDNNTHRVTIFNMGENVVDDIYDETAVKNAAVSSETIWGLKSINDIEITEAGNYIVHLYWNVGTGAKRTLAVETTLYERPVLTVTEENKLNVSYVDTTVITNARAQYFYFGENSIEGLDIYNETAVKAAAVSASSTIWNRSGVNKTVLSQRGNYVVHFYYNEVTFDENGEQLGSVKKTVAIATTIYDITKPTLTVDENNMLVAANTNVDATNIRATVYNLGDQTVADPSDETALKAIDSEAPVVWGLSNINKVQLDAANNYVIILRYNLGTSARIVILEVTR